MVPFLAIFFISIARHGAPRLGYSLLPKKILYPYILAMLIVLYTVAKVNLVPYDASSIVNIYRAIALRELLV